MLRLLYAPGADGRTAVDPDPWHGILGTERIRRELGFVPLYPTLRSAR